MNASPSHHRSDPASPSGPTGPAAARAVRRRFSVRRTRTGGWWVALVAAALVLLLLLIFALQNGRSVQISFLGANGTLPLGIALLLAAIGGVLIVAIPGTGRIIQLRHLARQQAQQAQRQARPELPASSAPPADQPTTSVDGKAAGEASPQ